MAQQLWPNLGHMVTLQLFANSQDYETYAPGQPIFTRGELGDRMYVVKSGTVELTIDGRVIESLSEGGVFGEMALIDSAPRSANAIAASETQVVPIDTGRFEFLTQQTPGFSLQVMRVLADRLRRTTEK